MRKSIQVLFFSVTCMYSAPKRPRSSTPKGDPLARERRQERARRHAIAGIEHSFVQYFLMATNHEVATHYANRSVGNHPFLAALAGGATRPAATPAQILHEKATAADHALVLVQRLKRRGATFVNIIQGHSLYHMGYLDYDVEAEVQTLGTQVNLQDAAAQLLAVKLQLSSIRS